ncbi:MAG TPA: hypothetical protein VG497_01945, partial [Kribbella sp.]|nr:hypothetical protein [Kribbella sp.]
RLASGGQFFEDFSFSGNSANLSRYNDELAKMYYSSSGGFGRESVSAWLQSFIAGASVQQGLASGSTVQQVPSFAGSYTSGTAAGEGIQVQVFLGNREITDIVDTRIRRSNRGVRRSVTTGSGGNR